MRRSSSIPVVAAACIAGCAILPSSSAASFPGQNGRIAFSANGIHTVLPDGSGEQVLTTEPSDVNPSWSPDGQRIVFTRRGAAANRAAIWVMNADGSGQTPVTGSSAKASNYPDYVSASFAPSGDRIVYSDGVGIRTVRIDGTDKEKLLRASDRDRVDEPPHGPVLGPVYSPNGRRIAFSNGSDGSSWRKDFGIWTMRADGSRLRKISDPGRPDADRFPDFSPDGRRIAFQRKFRGEVFTVAADGRDEQRVETQLQFSCEPAFSPRGDLLAFIGGNQVFTPNGPGCLGMFTVPASGGQPQQIPGGASPSWQPLP